MQQNDFQIVNDSICARREFDSRTLASMEKLSQRLEKVKALGGEFEAVEFSPYVDAVVYREQQLAIS